MMRVDREISSVLRREERVRNLRRLVREPIVAFPLAGAIGHFLVWLF